MYNYTPLNTNSAKNVRFQKMYLEIIDYNF